GRPPDRQEVFSSLPPEKLALITLNTALTAVCMYGADATITGIADQIGQLCRLEKQYGEMIKEVPQWKRRRITRFSPAYLDQLELEGANNIDDVKAGTWLISFLLNHTDGFIKSFRSASPEREYERARILALSPSSEAWFEAAHLDAEGLTPIRLPMVVVP